jgi:hypothetical protein
MTDEELIVRFLEFERKANKLELGYDPEYGHICRELVIRKLFGTAMDIYRILYFK